MEGHAVLITAAGSSRRMGIPTKKEYLTIGTRTVLELCIEAFGSTRLFSWFVVTVPPAGADQAKQALENWLRDPERRERTLFVEGAGTRQGSVRNGLLALRSYSPETVLIHDGARPWITPSLIQKVWEGAIRTGACAPVVPLVDSLKRLAPDRTIVEHVDRSAFVGIQTPQGFRFPEILNAHLRAASDGREYLDDTEIYHRYVGPVETVEGDRRNRKITYGEDLQPEHSTATRENLLSPAIQAEGSPDVPLGKEERIPDPTQRASARHTSGSPSHRVGFGYDLHPLVEGRPLWIGGVEIPSSKGEAGHSDGDVLVHAVIDALLGAVALGDIGFHFPPTDPSFKDISSRLLLRRVRNLIEGAGYQVGNLDCVVVLETPKLLPYRDNIRSTLAEDLGIDPERVSVKGKTKEKLDSVGRGEAVEAYATAMLFPRNGG